MNFVTRERFLSIRAHLHQASASMLRQLSDEACDSVLIENNGVTPEWVATYRYFEAIPLFSMRTESQALSQSCRSIDADAWCKRALNICLFHLLVTEFHIT